MVFYGHPDPILRSLPDLLRVGDRLASLARYAEVTERKRAELVRALAADESRRWVPETRALGVEKRGMREDDEIRRYAGDAREQSGSEKARAALSLGLRAEAGNAGVVDLAKRKERLLAADAILTSGDALRAALSAFPEPAVLPRPGESFSETEARRAGRKERQAAHESKRDGFLRELRLETARMLSAAEERYHAAWLRSAR